MMADRVIDTWGESWTPRWWDACVSVTLAGVRACHDSVEAPPKALRFRESTTMTDTLPDLPQEWPESLAPDAPVLTSKAAPPLGEPLLDFSAMSGTTFEQFCWWLLKKDHTAGRLQASWRRRQGTRWHRPVCV